MPRVRRVTQLTSSGYLTQYMGLLRINILRPPAKSSMKVSDWFSLGVMSLKRDERVQMAVSEKSPNYLETD